MIEFKKNVKEVLPYNRQHYIDFFYDGVRSNIKWYGVSFQLPHTGEGRKTNLKEFVETYESLFRDVILKLDNASSWIVNHEDRDLDWFPNGSDSLPHLRALFKQNNVPNKFKGALIFSTYDLLEFSSELISYPYAVLNRDGYMYRDLNVSHGKLQVIIKISGHLNIDFRSTDKELLKEIINENFSNLFIIKEYTGTSLG